jgi:acyl-CoA synthetase (AMP-forming)/AMP-acid ligase II
VSGAYVGTSSKLDDDGWLHTGDRGWLDVEGYLFCEGRADDTIIRGGENLGPAEIEDALLQHDAISGAAVVGLPDEEWGEKVAAMVTLRPGVDTVDLEHLREWVRTRLGSLKTPELVVVVEELPQTATGKVLRRQVRDDLLASLH